MADIIPCCLGSLEEEIYNVFRPYGAIDDLVINGDATALAAAGLAGGGMQLVMLPVFKLSSPRPPPYLLCDEGPLNFGCGAHVALAGSIQYRSVYSAMVAILCLRGSQLPGGTPFKLQPERALHGMNWDTV